MIIAALVFSVAGCAVFLAAHGVGALYLARSLQGVATGLASGPAGAALIELQPAGSQRAPLVTGAFSTLGLALGALITSARVQYAPSPTQLIWWALLLLAGVAVTFGAIATTTSAAFLAGTAIAGAGFGLGFSGAFRMTMALAAPSQSAGLVTAIFTVGYLAFSIPALIAGVAATTFGLRPTALVYSASLAALVAVAAGILLFGPSGKPARPAPASQAVMPPGPCTSPPCPRATDPPDGNPATTAKSSG